MDTTIVEQRVTALVIFARERCCRGQGVGFVEIFSGLLDRVFPPGNPYRELAMPLAMLHNYASPEELASRQAFQALV